MPTDMLLVKPCLARDSEPTVEFLASLSFGLKYEIDDWRRGLPPFRAIRALEGMLLGDSEWGEGDV